MLKKGRNKLLKPEETENKLQPIENNEEEKQEVKKYYFFRVNHVSSDGTVYRKGTMHELSDDQYAKFSPYLETSIITDCGCNK